MECKWQAGRPGRLRRHSVEGDRGLQEVLKSCDSGIIRVGGRRLPELNRLSARVPVGLSPSGTGSDATSVEFFWSDEGQATAVEGEAL